MNRAYLRPPFPLFRIAAGLALPLMLWGGYEIAVSRLSPLQSVYWGDYLSGTFVPSVPELPSFGPSTKKQEFQVLLCVGPKGAEVPITTRFEGATGQPDAHLAAVPMSKDEFAKWLRECPWSNTQLNRWQEPSVHQIPEFLNLLSYILNP